VIRELQTHITGLRNRQPCQTSYMSFHFRLGPRSASVRHRKRLNYPREISRLTCQMHVWWCCGRHGTVDWRHVFPPPRKPRVPSFRCGHRQIAVARHFELGIYCNTYREPSPHSKTTWYSIQQPDWLYSSTSA
jgi:hypothetical protein